MLSTYLSSVFPWQLADRKRLLKSNTTGNAAHKAPEVDAALRLLPTDSRLAAERSVIVDFSSQAVYEVGVLLLELAVTWKFKVDGYPGRGTGIPLHEAAMTAAGYPAGFIDLLARMTAVDPEARPQLCDAAEELDLLFDAKLSAEHSARVRVLQS